MAQFWWTGYHRAVLNRLAFACFLALSTGCAPAACQDDEERQVVREVEFLVGEQGPSADAAEERLIARGGEALLFLEAGLYEAEAPGRRRIAKVLTAIGDPAALPVLEHLAVKDPDSSVRDAAAKGVASLGTAADP
jgi:HEAT repeat protein